MRGRKHPDEVQAQVMAALLAGQGIMEVSRQYNLPESTIREWVDSDTIAEVRAQKGREIERLLFNYLTANLKALEAQAQVVTEAEYIKQQPADSLAVLHGVMADKSIRLLEAIHRASFTKSMEVEDGDRSEALPA